MSLFDTALMLEQAGRRLAPAPLAESLVALRILGELGGAEADAPVPDLDFMPSCANRIVGNVIVGDHHSGILAVRGSVRNVMRENMILGAKQWSVDSSVKQENAVVNIFSTAKPLNVRLSTDSSIVMPGEQKRSGKQTRCEGRPSPASGKMCPWDRVLAAPCGGL